MYTHRKLSDKHQHVSMLDQLLQSCAITMKALGLLQDTAGRDRWYELRLSLVNVNKNYTSTYWYILSQAICTDTVSYCLKLLEHIGTFNARLAWLHLQFRPMCEWLQLLFVTCQFWMHQLRQSHFGLFDLHIDVLDTIRIQLILENSTSRESVALRRLPSYCHTCATWDSFPRICEGRCLK